MSEISSNMLAITTNMNGLNVCIKGYRLIIKDKNHDQIVTVMSDTVLSTGDGCTRQTRSLYCLGGKRH